MRPPDGLSQRADLSTYSISVTRYLVGIEDRRGKDVHRSKPIQHGSIPLTIARHRRGEAAKRLRL